MNKPSRHSIDEHRRDKTMNRSSRERTASFVRQADGIDGIRGRSRQHGFSLIELLITITIVGILASVAIPAYQDSVRKSKRSDGEAALLQIEALQGRYFYDNGSYTTDLKKLGYATADNVDSPEGYYKSSVLAATSACPIASCFVLRALPQAEQADDGRMELTSSGLKRRDKNKDGDTSDAGEDSW